ncbi:hypothetical protein [Hankyongella ginsenosidimutans]|uniref:hypothetical protein n=1 Tax=Hankyongella ginsenosidimutans TaxID=1763828 RepID=UPI003CCC54FA
MAKLGLQGGIRLAVGLADEIRRPLARDLQVLDLAEIAAQGDGCLAAGFVHHGNQG